MRGSLQVETSHSVLTSMVTSFVPTVLLRIMHDATNIGAQIFSPNNIKRRLSTASPPEWSILVMVLVGFVALSTAIYYYRSRRNRLRHFNMVGISPIGPPEQRNSADLTASSRSIDTMTALRNISTPRDASREYSEATLRSITAAISDHADEVQFDGENDHSIYLPTSTAARAPSTEEEEANIHVAHATLLV